MTDTKQSTKAEVVEALRLLSVQHGCEDPPDPDCEECDYIAAARDLASRLPDASPSISECLLHRCASHYGVPQFNSTEASGAECGACVRDQTRAANRILQHELRAAPREATECSAEELAKLFHETYERLAPQFQYKTRKASAVPWSEVPRANRKLMIATCDEVLAARLAALAPATGTEGGE